jgi:hypothetical protein
MPRRWPRRLPVVQMRIARPTNQLARIVAFYRDGVGLPVIFSYEDDANYDGIMFGLPGRAFNLEITQHRGDGPCPVPSPDTLLVFYLLDKQIITRTVARLAEMGHHPVPPRNPYWEAQGITIPDPDGWHIVLMNTIGFGTDIAQ